MKRIGRISVIADPLGHAPPVGTPLSTAAADPLSAPAVVPMVGVSLGVDDPSRHFRTDHLMADLKGRSVRGGAITLAAQGCKFVLQVGSTMVLARLLTPGDFGLIAMVAVFTGFVSLFKDLGLSMATIQRAEITHAQVSTLFWINVAVSLLLSAVGIALAPVVAWVYGEPRLVGITIAISATFIFGGLAAQHTALLGRQMRFSVLAFSEVASVALAVIAAVFLAWWGMGYWSLVVMMGIQAPVLAVTAWMFCKWRPGLPRRGCGTRGMIAFGGSVTVANLLNYAGANLDYILIGRIWGTSWLGQYTRAYHLLKLPIAQLNTPLRTVAMPALSRSIDDPQHYRKLFLAVIEQIGIFTGPIAAVAVVFGDHVVEIVLGSQWDQAGELFQILAVAALILPLWSATTWSFLSQGRGGANLGFGVFDSVAKASSVLIGLPWGPTGVALGVAIRYYIELPVLFWLIGRGGPVQARHLYRALIVPVGTTASCLASLLAFRYFGIAEGMTPSGAVAISCVLAALSTTIGAASTRSGRAIVNQSWSMLRLRTT